MLTVRTSRRPCRQGWTVLSFLSHMPIIKPNSFPKHTPALHTTYNWAALSEGKTRGRGPGVPVTWGPRAGAGRLAAKANVPWAGPPPGRRGAASPNHSRQRDARFGKVGGCRGGRPCHHTSPLASTAQSISAPRSPGRETSLLGQAGCGRKARSEGSWQRAGPRRVFLRALPPPQPSGRSSAG